jgi:predicted DNA-binding protein
MSATRTQVYLTEAQRTRIDALRAQDGRTMAQIVREALDRYLEEEETPDLQTVLDATFGSRPDFEVPSRDEWDRGYG